MRKFCFLIACIFGGALAAETIGNVEFQFPPSTYDWVLLTDTNAYCASEMDEEGCDTPGQMKFYTHKAGDALEFFTAASILDDDTDSDGEEEERFQTAEFAQLFINDLLKAYFPNHRISITNLTETNNDGFLEWELNDGVQDILHGFCRYLNVNGNDVILSYMTTASKSADNTALWTDALHQAKPVE